MKTYNWEGVNPDGYFLDKLEPIPSALPSFQKLFQVSATALSILGRSRHLARKLSLRRKRSSPNVFEMAATETITSIILIKLIRVSLGTVRHPRRFKIVVIDIQITL